jgi:hypothetical protein
MDPARNRPMPSPISQFKYVLLSQRPVGVGNRQSPRNNLSPSLVQSDTYTRSPAMAQCNPRWRACIDRRRHRKPAHGAWRCGDPIVERRRVQFLPHGMEILFFLASSRHGIRREESRARNGPGPDEIQ